jgi:hypothetical protein
MASVYRTQERLDKTMASWYVLSTTSFHVKPEGKNAQQKTVDMQNPRKSLEELEAKVGLKCPEERKAVLLEGLRTETGVPTWASSVTIPEWYITASPADVSNALQWGCEVVLGQKELSDAKLHEQLNLSWKKKLEQVQSEFEEAKREVERRRGQAEEKAEEWRRIAAENLSKSDIDSKVKALRQEWMEEQSRTFTAMDQHRQTLTQQVEQLQVKTMQLEQERVVLQTKLDQKSTHEALMNKSVHKGDVGESLASQWLQTAFLGATIVNTSKNEGEMDLRMTWNDFTILVDVKNHDSRLHSVHDVQKFKDNLRDASEVQVGILLCTKIHVPHHNQFWVETEILGEDKLAVYMNNVSANPIERLQLIAGTILRPWKEYVRHRRALSEQLAGDELKQWTETARGILMNGWTSILRLHVHWVKTQTGVQAALGDFQSEFTAILEEMKHGLDTLAIAVDVPAVSPAKKSRAKKSA